MLFSYGALFNNIQSNFSEMDEGKQQALFEFGYLAAKEGGYSKDYVKDFNQLSKEYLIPMISALVNEKLVSSENEFDEAMYALDQYSPKIVKDQLKVEEAKNGDKVEIMKFFAALVYEFRVRSSTVFTRLCKRMSGANQHNIAHFIVYLDNAIPENDRDWWKILFMSYSNDDLTRLGAVKTATSIRTPCKTPMRSSASDNPVDIVINSPAGKDRLIKEYERRLKSERELVQSLQSHFDELYDENSKLKVQVDSLKEKLETTNKNRTSTCGEDCPNRNELAAMKIMVNVRDNKVQNLTAELGLMQKDMDSINEAADKTLLENRQLQERTDFLNSELERLHQVSNELHETRQKLSAVIKEKDDLLIKSSLNTDLSANVRQLSNENSQLRNENGELAARLSPMEQTISELRLSLDAKNRIIAELSAKLEELGKKQQAWTEEQNLREKLQAFTDENKRLNDEFVKMRSKMTDAKFRAEEAERRCDLLEEQHKSELKNAKQVQNVRPKATTFFVSMGKEKDLKPISEPTDLMQKSFISSASSVSVAPPIASGTPLAASRRLSFMSKFRPTPESTAEFKYDDKNRLSILRERNQKTLPHLRSYYATELNSEFSPSQTMKFNKK